MKTVAALLALLDGLLVVAAVVLTAGLTLVVVLVLVLAGKEPSIAWLANTFGVAVLAYAGWVLFWPTDKGENK